MSTSILKALPGKLDIKRHSPSVLYLSASLAMSTSVLKALPGKLDFKRHSPSVLYLYTIKSNLVLVILKFVFRFFSQNFSNTIIVSNCLEPDQDRQNVGPDLGPNCLQRLSADNKSGP